MRNGGACTPWQRARFNAVREYDHLRLQNEKLGVGNSHMMDPMEFALLINKSDASFDPYEYMEEMQEKISLHCSDYDFPIAAAPVGLSDDDSPQDSVVAAQESSRVLPAVEHKSSPQESDLPVAALRKNIDELLSAFELSLDPSSFKNKKNQEAFAALKKNIEELLSDFDPYPSEKKNQDSAVAVSNDAENENEKKN